MTDEEKKNKRMEYLGECLRKFTRTEPKLSLKEIAEVISIEIGDITPFLNKYKRELKK